MARKKPRKLVPTGKKLILLSILIIYIVTAGVVWHLTETGILSRIESKEYTVEGEVLFEPLPRTEIEESLQAAKGYVERNLVRANGHVDLYEQIGSEDIPDYNQTNSEAMTYYLLWTVKDGNKASFDRALTFIQDNMIHPQGQYMMWRLESDDVARGEGQNIASDADLRAIHALYLAEQEWGDQRYTDMIEQLAIGLETTVITNDTMLAPYAGYIGEVIWSTEEVWLSYADYTAFSVLAERRGQPWITLQQKMKEKTINAKSFVGLYLPKLTEQREYSLDIDGPGHGINSFWMLVRSAESGDKELQEAAQDTYEIYKERFIIDGELFGLYNDEAVALSPRDTPWPYAFVARTAVHLNDIETAEMVLKHLIEEKQDRDVNSEHFGAFIEGHSSTERVGQFTMQEIILTLQDYLDATQES